MRATAATTRTRKALDEAEHRFVAQVVTERGIGPWRTAADQRLQTALDAFTRRNGLSRRVAADLIVALVDRPTRDRCVQMVESRTDVDWREFWRHLSRRSLRPYRTEALFLLAWSAWRVRDVRLARAAADEVLALDPGHRATALLLASLWLDVAPARLPSLAGPPAISAGAP
jgi:Domain of unknown function (DUF4192)